ncbi:MAG: hypothetical protein V1914_03615 [archaeon]
MKFKGVLSFLIILVLLSSIVSAGFFGNLLTLVTGKSIAKEGFYIEYDLTFDLSKSSSCNGKERVYSLKSYSDDLIEIVGQGVKTKEIYVTLGGCRGLFYKDEETGNPVSLKVVATDLIIGNRYYSLKITPNIDFSSIYGAGYMRVETTILSSDEKNMKLESAASKTDKVYLFESGSKVVIVYGVNGNMLTIPAAKEMITFDMSQVLVPKKVETPKTTVTVTAETTSTSDWDEERVAGLETQVALLSDKIDLLTDAVTGLNGEEEQESEGFWSKLFRG